MSVAALVLASTPLSAQQQTRLEDLIPDEAVEDPEAWAQQGLEAGSDDAPAGETEADPADYLTEMVEIAPDVSDLPDPERLEPGEPVEFATFEQDIPPGVEMVEERLAAELVLLVPADRELFPDREEVLDRFRSLSTILQLDSGDSFAQLAAQARTDEDILGQILRTYGYYDARIIRTAGGGGAGDESQPVARFEITPGERYLFGAIDLGNLAAAGEPYDNLRATFEIFPQDPIQLDAVEQERSDLAVELGEQGFPFAELDEPSLLIDHERVEGDLTMPVTPGGRYNFGRVVSGDEEFLSGRHLSTIARFAPGDLYQRSEQVDLRRAILATGIVGSATLTPVVVQEPQGDEPGIVDISADITPAPLRTLAGNIGFGTEEGVRLEASWEHRNLFPPEGMLRARAIAGTQEQLLGLTFRKNNFKGRDRILTLDAYASTIDYQAYDARTASLSATYEKVSSLLSQQEFSWSIGTEFVATSESERDAQGRRQARETYLVAALPLYAQLDRSDDLLDPSTGWRVSGRLSPEVSRNNDVQSFYLRSQADASYYASVTENVVLAGRARIASIPGTAVDNIAPSRRLYAGGGGSVRGYGYREIGPRNDTGDPMGGRSLVELSLEARIRTGFMDGAVSVVPFIDAGSVGEDATPDFRTIKYGAGVGIRYDTGFGPLRLDVATPLNPGPNDSWIAVYVALGQAF